MTQPSDDGFDYQGYLIFNGLFRVDMSNSSVEWSKMYDAERLLFEELGEFSRTYRGSNRGLERLTLRDYIRDDESINDETLQSVADDLIGYRVLYEEEEIEAYPPGSDELTQVKHPVVNDADLYWMHPKYLFFRGSESDSSEAIDYVSQILRGSPSPAQADGGLSRSTPRIDPIQFEKNFLLWVFKQQFYDNTPPNKVDLEIDSLTDAEISGEDDIWGGSSSIGNTPNLREAPPILQAILKDKKFDAIEGEFRVGDHIIIADVQTNKVHIKVSKDINRSNKIRRVALANLLLNRLAELKSYWDGLPKTKKYPEYGFFEDLYSVLNYQGASIDKISEDLRERMADLRDESDSTWDL